MIGAIIEWSIHNRYLVILAALALGVAGVRAMVTMPVGKAVKVWHDPETSWRATLRPALGRSRDLVFDIYMPASALFGASFLIACDLVARVAFAPTELPVGVVTALVGGPCFLWLLFRHA